MTKAEPIFLFEGTRVVAFNAGFRDDGKLRVFDVTCEPRDAVERAVAEGYPKAHVRFVFAEAGRALRGRASTKETP